MSTTAHESSDVRDFARSLQRVCGDHLGRDGWTPDHPCDDRDDLRRAALDAAGWFDLSIDPEGSAFVGPGAVELGRALVSIDCIDAVLGHGVALGPDLAGGLTLARCSDAGQSVWLFGAATMELVEIVSVEPVSHLDSQHVTIVQTRSHGTDSLANDRVETWIAAMTGYLAGLASGAADLAMTHAVGRMAFGKPLASIEAVAIKLADIASVTEGLQMAAEGDPSLEVLGHAAHAVSGVMKDCHQILGALGFTVEFPLQRYSRRSSALAAWTVPMVGTLDAMRNRTPR